MGGWGGWDATTKDKVFGLILLILHVQVVQDNSC